MPYGGSGYGGIFNGTAPVYVDRSQMVNQGLDRLLAGFNAAQALSDKLKLERDQQLALGSPVIAALVQRMTGVGAPPAPAALPGLEDQFSGANLGASAMAPTLGLSMQPPRGLMPAASAPVAPMSNARAVDQFPSVTVGMGPIEMLGAAPPSAPAVPAPTGFGEDMIVNGLTPRGPKADMRPAKGKPAAPFANMTEFNMFKDLVPYATQRDVAMMQNEGANQRTNTKAQADLSKATGRLSMDMIKLAEARRNLETRLASQMDQIRLRAKLKTGAGGSGLKELEFLRKTVADVASKKAAAEQLAATYDSLGGSAAEQGSPLRMNYDAAIAEVARYRVLEGEARTLFTNAMSQSGLPLGGQPAPRGPQKGLGRPIQSKDDLKTASDGELLDLLRKNGLAP